jgi:hypothetical protein
MRGDSSELVAIAGMTCMSLTLTNTLKDTLLLTNRIHLGLLFVNFEALNRHQLCRWFWSIQMIKIMQMKMMNVTALMRLRSLLVMMAM